MKKYIIPVSESFDLKLEGTIATSPRWDDSKGDGNWNSQKADGPWSSDMWNNSAEGEE